MMQQTWRTPQDQDARVRPSPDALGDFWVTQAQETLGYLRKKVMKV